MLKTEMRTYSKDNELPKLTVKVKTLAAIIAVMLAVILPQVLYTAGLVTGIGTSLGEMFLPMHLPVMLVGFLAGPFVGAVSGFCAPLVSFALTGMPMAAMLPFMIIELTVYGLCGGALRNVKMPVFGKVLLAQIAGRAVRAGAILASVYVFGNNVISAKIIVTSITVGAAGIVLQWILIPVVLYAVGKGNHNETRIG